MNLSSLRRCALFSLVIGISWSITSAHAQELKTLDYPGAANTQLTAINSQNDVAGYYNTSSSPTKGFYTQNRKFHTVSVKNSDTSTVTYASGLDDRYNVVGWYTCCRGASAGFGIGPDMRQFYNAFDAYTTELLNVTPTTGVVSGYFDRSAWYGAGGFYYVNGQYIVITYPGSCSEVEITGGNDQGQFVGYCVGFPTKGFLYDGVSVFTDISFPGAYSTFPNRISNSGEIVGTYQKSDGKNHGFTYVNGVFAPVDFPGASSTQVLGVNASGAIVGFYTTFGNHGFIGVP